MSLSQDIRDLLLAILHDEVIPMSWGISEINVGSDRVSFFVYGLIYTGRIEITAVDRHKYRVVLDGSNRGDYQLESIFASIDSLIELNGSYLNAGELHGHNT